MFEVKYNMFEVLFGWRKASRCKRLIRHVQCRLKLLRNKRDSIIRQLRDDVAQLIKDGHVESAFSRIEQLFKDQSLRDAYELLDHFCEFVIINLPYIRKHRDLPNDVNKAVSTLIYASARCGDLPELQKLRKLFGERYGQRFAMVAVELSLGNLVNQKIIENLSTKSISDDLKLSLLKELAKDNGLHQLELPGYDDNSALQHQLLVHTSCDLESIEHFPEKDFQFLEDDIGQAQMNDSDPLDEPKKIHNTSSGQTDPIRCSSNWLTSTSVQHKSESPSHSSERSIVYLDDVEEFEPCIKECDGDKDQRFFMFKSDVPSRKTSPAVVATNLFGSHHDQMGRYESSDGKTSSRGSSKRRKPSRRRLKRRSVIAGNKLYESPIINMSMKDGGCALYYGEPGDSSADEDSKRSQPQRKHQQKMLVEESLISSISNEPKKHVVLHSPYRELKVSDKVRFVQMENDSIARKCGFSQRRNRGSGNFSHDCCFERPCCFVATADIDDWRNPSRLRKNVMKNFLEFSSDEEALSTNLRTNYLSAAVKVPSYSMKNQDDGSVSLPKSPMIRDYKKGMDVIIPSQNDKLNEQGNEMEEAEVIDCRVSCASSHDSFSRVSSPWRQTRPPYVRATTMPPERPKYIPSYQMPRTISSLSPQPNSNRSSCSCSSSSSHIHPRLPDYDDLSAQFKAMKKERTQS